MQRVSIWAKTSGLPAIWVTLLHEEEECSLESCALPLQTGSDPSWPRMICWTKSLLGHPQAIDCPKLNKASGSLTPRGPDFGLRLAGRHGVRPCAHTALKTQHGGWRSDHNSQQYPLPIHNRALDMKDHM